MCRVMLSLAILMCGFNATAAADFKFSFEWGNIKKCTSGNPNRVPNPIFKLQNVPDGTAWIYFRMIDRNVPSYNHGGGWVKFEGRSAIQPGAFIYNSPCPPGGRHTYEWTASAKSKKSSIGGTLATAKASKQYP